MLILFGVIVGVFGCGIAAWTDLKEYRISNQLMAWMCAIGLVFATWRSLHPESEHLEYLWGPVKQAVLIGFGAALFLFVLRLIHDGIREKLKLQPKTFIGGGDIKLIAVSSFFFPLYAYLLIFIVTIILISVIETVRFIFYRKKYYAFAPYMFFSSILVTVFAIKAMYF